METSVLPGYVKFYVFQRGLLCVAGIMICLGITVTILHCVDTAHTYRSAYCHKVRMRVAISRHENSRDAHRCRVHKLEMSA